MADSRVKFTYGDYREFLSRLKEEYSFISFAEGKELYAEADGHHAILRHDIDMDPGKALTLSEIEADLGISATYFFMIRNPLYNVFSETGTLQVKQILENGHRLGLHFDCAVYPDISLDNLNTYVNTEIALLETYFGKPVEAVSFHRPGNLEMNGVILDDLPNTYEEVFVKEFGYFSDSRGEWAWGHPLDSEAFREKRNLHILVHPVWWNDGVMTAYACLEGVLERLGDQAEEYIAANCQVWNRDKPE